MSPLKRLCRLYELRQTVVIAMNGHEEHKEINEMIDDLIEDAKLECEESMDDSRGKNVQPLRRNKSPDTLPRIQSVRREDTAP